MKSHFVLIIYTMLCAMITFTSSAKISNKHYLEADILLMDSSLAAGRGDRDLSVDIIKNKDNLLDNSIII